MWDQTANFALEVEGATLLVNQTGFQVGGAIFIPTVTMHKPETGTVGVQRMLSLLLQHTAS